MSHLSLILEAKLLLLHGDLDLAKKKISREKAKMVAYSQNPRPSTLAIKVAISISDFPLPIFY